jgi:hypothetical protein
MGKLPQRQNPPNMGEILRPKRKPDMIEAFQRSMIKFIWKYSIWQWGFRNDKSHKDKARTVAE